MITLAARVQAVLTTAGVVVESVSIGRLNDKSTWKVHPVDKQAQAQPHIDAFVEPTPAQIADEEALAQVEGQRAIKATVMWTLRRVLGRAPTGAEIQTARSEWIAIYKAL